MSKSRCFILDQCTKDVQVAGAYGQIVYLFNHHKGRASVWSPEYSREVIKQLDKVKFDPKNDYLVVVGHQLNLILAIAAMITKYGTINLLFFYPPEQRYRPVSVGTSNSHISLGDMYAPGSSDAVQNS
jgi:hypothetical protein